MKDCVQKIFKNEGVLGFYRGGVVNLIKIIPAAAVQFSTYDYLKEVLFE
jgi:hypothetical protein